MSTIEGDTSPSSPPLRQGLRSKALAEKVVFRTTLRGSVLLREACVCISTRAARLSAVGIGSLLEMVP
ncbi:hypothetical protein AB1Y20_012245 [Prymnesium parvum]|uniref:Hexokinase C-terminal domain-containing protein n=1 Tax=Prymnesium parvum TaxID=97485 RepID=A0AB34IQP3_PRYPA